jgi:bleomycin hydrolase
MRIVGTAILAVGLATEPVWAQADTTAFGFQVVRDLTTTPVKDQARTGTCWSFATTSFFETELIRQGKPALDLSEMFFVRMNYADKARNYVRMHGEAAMGEGSLAGDVLRVIREHGVVPDEVYPGRRYGGERHDHSELHAVLKAAADALIARGRLQPVWPDAVAGILDAYLGDPPETFTADGRRYTPASYRDALGIRPDDYVELTSFTHHPFDVWFSLEIPDNWARNRSFNVPLDLLVAVMDTAIARGYSVAWDGDVSERSFCQAKGVAVWPAASWETRSEEQRRTLCDAPEPEAAVTPEARQAGFDDYSSSDDHLMHVTGIARDRNGTEYYITKNSWGLTGPAAGFVYLSEAFVRAKTMSIVVHRDALPAVVARRLAAVR